MELKAGTSLQGGKYRIERVLGKGGFGITYLAYQKGLNRYVAVKEFFMSDYCNREESTCAVSIPSVGSREMVDRYKSKFVKEAQIIADLDNPHIVPIYDVFEENGTAYYVMKYIGGGSLSSLVKKGKSLSLDVALKYVRQVADALAYCHERNIAHLDVKPGNILIQDGVAVLIDFGISKHYNEDGDQTSSTPIGISKGYAPLEQYKKGGVTTFSPVTDIYSLGAVLFMLVTGQTPPDADEVNEDGLPEFPSDVPQHIQDAITSAMQPKKKDRPQSIDDLLAMLVEPTVEDIDEDDSEDTEVKDEDSEDAGVDNEDSEDTELEEEVSEDSEMEDDADPAVDNDSEDTELEEEDGHVVLKWIDVEEFCDEYKTSLYREPLKLSRKQKKVCVIFGVFITLIVFFLDIIGIDFDSEMLYIVLGNCWLVFLGIFTNPEWKTRAQVYDVEYLDKYQNQRKGDKATPASSYAFRVRNKEGLLGLCVFRNNNVIPLLEIEFDDIIKVDDRSFILRKGKMYGLFRLNTLTVLSKKNWVFSMEYEMIEMISDNGHLRVTKDNNTCIYNSKGYRIIQ